MFIHKVPLFNPGPLHKGILDAMRDLTLLEQTARFARYSDGILVGCGLIERNMNIGVSTGLVKFGGRVYVLASDTSLPYQPTDQWTVLKVRFGPEEKSRDFLCFTGELVLDNNTEVLPNEMEFGRFKLKQGSRLRTEYVDFQDLVTEYDTVNLLNIPFAGIGEVTVSPVILKLFAKEAYPYAETTLDITFCCAALTGSGIMSRESIYQYLWRRLKLEMTPMQNTEIHRHLTKILYELKGLDGDSGGFDDDDSVVLM